MFSEKCFNLDLGFFILLASGDKDAEKHFARGFNHHLIFNWLPPGAYQSFRPFSWKIGTEIIL